FPAASLKDISCAWGFGPGDVGYWQAAVNAVDQNTTTDGVPTGVCTGNPDKVAPWPTADGWFNCGNNDVVNFTVQDLTKISGNIFDYDKSSGCTLDGTSCTCSSISTLSVAPDSKLTWLLDSMLGLLEEDVVDANGNYDVVSDYGTAGIEALTSNMTPGSPDVRLVPKCVMQVPPDANLKFNVASYYMGFVPTSAPYMFSGQKVLNLGYVFETSLEGWMTSISGDVYSKTTIDQTVPTTAAPTFKGTLVQSADYETYAFSDDEILVGTAGENSESRIFDDGSDNGAASGLGASKFDISLDLDAPGDTGSLNVSNPFSNVSTGAAHKIDVSAFNSYFKNYATDTVEYSVEGNGVAVVYITGAGVVDISKGFRPANVNTGGRILLITTNEVMIRKNVGMAAPAVDSVANIMASITTSKDITIESDPLAELSLVVQGSLISTKGIVKMSRDRVLQNSFPSLVVRYDPAYLYSLTTQKRNSTQEDIYSNLFKVNVDWKTYQEQ
ncbi:MAG: hypothetical protein WC243_01485, partial [Patescibacteria group bacterium]